MLICVSYREGTPKLKANSQYFQIPSNTMVSVTIRITKALACLMEQS